MNLTVHLDTRALFASASAAGTQWHLKGILIGAGLVTTAVICAVVYLAVLPMALAIY